MFYFRRPGYSGDDAPPYSIVFGEHEDGQSRGEVSDLLVLAYDGHDGVDLLGVTRLGWQLVLCRHPQLSSPHLIVDLGAS